MTPRFSSPLPLSKSTLSSLSNLKTRLSTKRARLTLGAAATAAAVAGIAIGASASPAPATLPTALNHAGVTQVTPPAGSPLFRGGQASSPANGPAQRTFHVKLALDKHANRHAAANRAAVATRHGVPHPQHHRAIVARPAKPYLIYDSTTPSAIPAHHVAAAYATGNYAASPSQLAGKGPVVWIDTTGYDPKASALDVEPGDATPSLAASWAFHRLSQQPHALARIYTMRSEWPAVQSAVASLPHKMQSRVRWWIADPTGVPHIVPGSAATQWYWGGSYDITTATPGF